MATASGAMRTSVSSARTTVSGDMISTTNTSLGRGPRTDLRAARVDWARSAARSKVMIARETARPAIGSTTVSAMAAIMTARPAMVFGRAVLAGGRGAGGAGPV